MTTTYRNLIVSTLEKAIDSTKEANDLLTSRRADYHVLQAAAAQLHQAARAADKAIGIIEAHRVIQGERDEPN